MRVAEATTSVRARHGIRNLNGFGEKALYDLTFKVPKNNVVISVGKTPGQIHGRRIAVSHWVTPVPVAVAGFNYGQYTRMDYPDPIDHYEISGYYLTELPSVLKQFGGGAQSGGSNPMQANALSAMAPGAMTKYALDQTRAQMQLCNVLLRQSHRTKTLRSPNSRISISGNPGRASSICPFPRTLTPRNAGCFSAPSRTTSRDSCRKSLLMKWRTSGFGHSVTWASYHDLWLSEGFADFSAGLFLEKALGQEVLRITSSIGPAKKACSRQK